MTGSAHIFNVKVPAVIPDSIRDPWIAGRGPQ
jgi:hypothetical protein